MLLVVDIDELSFWGNKNFLKFETPFIYYADRDNKCEGIYRLTRYSDGKEEKIIIWHYYDKENLKELEEYLTDRIHKYLKEYSFYNNLITIDLTFDEVLKVGNV